MAKPVVVFVVGTRPDAIKSAPVIREFLKFESVQTIVVATGQHREMLAQALDAFGLKADDNLDIMQPGQTLASITSRSMEGLYRVFESFQPSFVFAQGDTTTTFAASVAAFYLQVPFGHIEAGLRTDRIDNPFPEEFNRRASALISTLHFAPTQWAADNLIREGHDPQKIFVTGNTGIDAVRFVSGANKPDGKGRMVLLTTHRRENWGSHQEAIARAALRLVEQHPDISMTVPMHKNPAVRETLRSVLDGHDRISLIEPPDYRDFVLLMQQANLILTDSGGVQEEAPAFGIPVLVLRETTERPEGVTAGTAELVGTDEERIFERANELLSNPQAYAKMSNAVSPYGDGRAAQRIRFVALKYLGIESPAEEMWTSSKR